MDENKCFWPKSYYLYIYIQIKTVFLDCSFYIWTDNYALADMIEICRMLVE